MAVRPERRSRPDRSPPGGEPPDRIRPAGARVHVRGLRPPRMPRVVLAADDDGRALPTSPAEVRGARVRGVQWVCPPGHRVDCAHDSVRPSLPPAGDPFPPHSPLPATVGKAGVRRRAFFAAAPHVAAAWRAPGWLAALAALTVPWVMMVGLLRTRRPTVVAWRGRRYDVRDPMTG